MRQRQWRLMLCSFLFPAISFGNTTPSADDTSAENDKVDYNSGFIQGLDIDVADYSYGNPVPEGTYTVELMLNGSNRGKHSIPFKNITNNKRADACFTLEQIEGLGITPDSRLGDDADISQSDVTNDGACHPISFYVRYAKSYYNTADLVLNITVPQASLSQQYSDYIDPSRWDEGVTALFVDYNLNSYLSNNKSGNDKSTYHNTNINWMAGFNYGGWRFRNRSNSVWSKDNSFSNKNIQLYAETDITPWKSKLTLGETFTSGRIFDSYGIRGAVLGSNTKMQPDSLNSFVPVITGIADSNARVLIRQNEYTIYETTVTPGPFEIKDYGALGTNGTLQLVIIEADGREKIQDIVFSAPPMMLHPGTIQYSISAGELRDGSSGGSPAVIEGEFLQGINNFLTWYTGFQLSENYQSVAVGNALNTPLGGISVDMMHARSDLKEKIQSGESFRISYSRLFEQTDTNVIVSSYRYSNDGYLTFRDATMLRERGDDYDPEKRDENGRIINSYLGLQAKNQYSLNLSQRAWGNSSISVIGSYYDYWTDRSPSSQWSVSYQQGLEYFSYSLGYQRAKTGQNSYDNSYVLNVNIPFYSKGYNDRPLFNSLSLTTTRNADGNTSFQTSADGSQGEQSELSYAIGAMTNSHSDVSDSLNGSVSYRTSVGTYGVTGSMDNKSSRQASVSANGSIVAHKGGVTLGPSIGNSAFAIIEAQGAEGTTVLSGSGSKVDSRGYAIVPALSSYRENRVGLDASKASMDVDLIDDQQVIVPRDGAAIAVKIKTISGKPVVLIVKDKNGNFLPIGTNIYDNNGEYQTIVGQAGMAYLRGWDGSNTLSVKSGTVGECVINPEPGIAQKISATADTVVQVEVKCI
ncbi:fimbria/pilus outer membrane usher protein [Morganella morganii]|uniref:fimbria/pilus outer membrane usher protein n=1 Tax=Morganella morganii TaxID=582 RepID=UPI00189A161D|nr:fimbria/pilus outer membrane usher protein [Morganella morganii]